MSTSITVNIKYEYFYKSEHKMSNTKHRPVNVKLERKHKTRAKKKNFRAFENLLYETLNNKHETYYLKYATINMKYEYLCNSEHKMSNIKHRTINIKFEYKQERRTEKKKFGVFRNLLNETLNNTRETCYLKYATINIKYEYLFNSEHKMSNMTYRPVNVKLECKSET